MFLWQCFYTRNPTFILAWVQAALLLLWKESIVVNRGITLCCIFTASEVGLDYKSYTCIKKNQEWDEKFLSQCLCKKYVLTIHIWKWIHVTHNREQQNSTWKGDRPSNVKFLFTKENCWCQASNCHDSSVSPGKRRHYKHSCDDHFVSSTSRNYVVSHSTTLKRLSVSNYSICTAKDKTDPSKSRIFIHHVCRSKQPWFRFGFWDIATSVLSSVYSTEIHMDKPLLCSVSVWLVWKWSSHKTAVKVTLRFTADNFVHLPGGKRRSFSTPALWILRAADIGKEHWFSESNMMQNVFLSSCAGRIKNSLWVHSVEKHLANHPWLSISISTLKVYQVRENCCSKCWTAVFCKPCANLIGASNTGGSMELFTRRIWSLVKSTFCFPICCAWKKKQYLFSEQLYVRLRKTSWWLLTTASSSLPFSSSFNLFICLRLWCVVFILVKRLSCEEILLLCKTFDLNLWIPVISWSDLLGQISKFCVKFFPHAASKAPETGNLHVRAVWGLHHQESFALLLFCAKETKTSQASKIFETQHSHFKWNFRVQLKVLWTSWIVSCTKKNVIFWLRHMFSFSV